MLVGLALVAMSPIADAKGGGGGHGGGGGGHGGGGHAGGGNHGGGGGAHWNGGGGYYHGGYGHYGYRGGFYGGFYPGFYGLGYGYGGYGYPGYGYGYFNDGYAVPTTVYVNPTFQVAPVVPDTSMIPTQPQNRTAQIDVVLPTANAQVWVDGNSMTAGSGTRREFVSPNLDPGYSYSYRVTVSWVDNGRQIRAEKVIPVAPGRASLADFSNVNTAPAAPQ